MAGPNVEGAARALSRRRRNTTCLRYIASGLGGWSAVLALGCRQVGIFLPILLMAAEAREVGPLLRSPQQQAHAGRRLELHLFLHTKVSTSGQTPNSRPSHWPEAWVPHPGCYLEIGSLLPSWVASATHSVPTPLL